jgi:hypothetical protein
MSLYHRFPKISRALAAWIARPMHVQPPLGERVDAFVFFNSMCEAKARSIQVCFCFDSIAEICSLPLSWEDGDPDLVEAMVAMSLHQAAATAAVKAIKKQRDTSPPSRRKRGRP